MALINNIYIHVTSEDVSRETKLSMHSVEKGIDQTDNSKPQATELSLKGKIVSYTETVRPAANAIPPGIKAWISLVKKDGSAFDTMGFERLNNELITFENGVSWVDTGAVQYIDENGSPIDISDSSDKVYQVKFEVNMPYEGRVRIQNAYTEYCAFNIINKSSSGYAIQDYNADEDTSDIVYSNTYNGQRGRVRTEFTNYDNPLENTPGAVVERSAAWVLQQLEVLRVAGASITYEGRNGLSNFQIKSFSTSHTYENAGGADFSMTLQECRTALNSYGTSTAAIQSGGTQQISRGDNMLIYYTVQDGDIVYNLVAADNAPYKNLKRITDDGVTHSAMEYVMLMNPGAFEIYGDYTTLKAGVSILLGTR